LIVRRFDHLTGPQLSFEPLFESPYLVATGATNPWLKRRRIALAELMDEFWALPPPDDSFGPFVLEAFRAGGLDYPKASVLAAAHDLRVNLLRTGRYLSILPEFLLRFPTEHPFIRKLPVELPIASAPIGVILLKNRMPSPVVQRFIDCAREVAKPLAKKKV
jgi:DNA-binding transcriptional LysR family regulator